MTDKKIYIFALAATGIGISGSDRIFIEFARRWSKAYSVSIYVWEEGYQMCLRHKLQITNISKASLLQKQNVKYQISNMEPWRKFGFVVNYFARIIEGIRIGLTLKMENNQNTVVYSASEFWMDSLPALVLKLRYPNVGWVASWYQTAPNPWKGFTEGEREEKHRLSTLIYWLMQFPIKPSIERWADLILVNNEEERQVFPKRSRKGKVMVVLGAVDVKGIEIWRRKLRNQPKIFDAVFQGRFHPQKGVLELIDIWRFVVEQKSDAQLVMVGDGPLMKNVRLRIKNLKLEKNVILKGFLFDGEEKYRIFSQSKIVVHPAFYDSGGMASAEAMAFGLPAIGFDLKSFKSYYPQGMIKVKIGDMRVFAKCIVELLNEAKKRVKLGKEAQQMIKKNWSWDERAKEVLSEINKNL